jgi:hypothetical protein
MATITGKVINADGSANSGAKVYVSDFKGTLTPKKIGAISDDKGNFTLDITDKDGEYISASDSLKNLVVTKIKENVTDYLLDMGAGRVQQTQEVVVFAPQRPNKKNNKWIYLLLMGLGALGMTYVAIKQYKSK